MFNATLFYLYLIFIHMNGRVIDLYIWLNGDINAFFIPWDDEVSRNYLKWVCHKALKYNQRMTNTNDTVLDENAKPWTVSFIHVYMFGKSIILRERAWWGWSQVLHWQVDAVQRIYSRLWWIDSWDPHPMSCSLSWVTMRNHWIWASTTRQNSHHTLSCHNESRLLIINRWLKQTSIHGWGAQTLTRL